MIIIVTLWKNPDWIISVNENVSSKIGWGQVVDNLLPRKQDILLKIVKRLFLFGDQAIIKSCVNEKTFKINKWF